MKFCSKMGVWISILVLTVFSGNALAAQKVLVVTGNSEEAAARVGTYRSVYEGIKEGLGTQDIVPEFLHVALGDLETDAAKAAEGAVAIEKIKAARPDLVITLNDDCLKYIGAKIDDIPVVFAYIWGKPEMLGLPKANVTGVTRRSYAADIWSLAHHLTGAQTVAVLSKNNPSMQGVKHYLTAGADKLAQASGVKLLDMYLLDTFAEWQEKVNTFPAGFIYLADTSRIDNQGTPMKDADLVSWTVDNAKVPVIGATEKDTQAGALFAIVTSEKAIGLHAADIALKILGGAKPADIPYVTSVEGKLLVNGRTAQKYNIDIPYEILSTADKIYE